MTWWFLIPGVLLLVAGLVELKTDWVPWPLRLSLWGADGLDGKQSREAEQFGTALWLLVAGLTLILLATGVFAWVRDQVR
jgi:hypothetical protein